MKKPGSRSSNEASSPAPGLLGRIEPFAVQTLATFATAAPTGWPLLAGLNLQASLRKHPYGRLGFTS